MATHHLEKNKKFFGGRKYNNKNKTLAINSGASYIDVTTISRKGLKQPILVTSDNLHPSAVMYALWAALLLEEMKVIIR